jgi:Zn-dependent protease/CBS domain-containing protein
MFGTKIPLFKLFGFQVNIDPSWFFIFFLISWTLATGEFPRRYAGLAESTYWLMGLTSALGLFASIVLHEFSHSMVARSFGIEMKGITLFIFGGVAEMTEEPPSPKAEFFVAIAGPIASVLIAGLSGLIFKVAIAQDWSVVSRGIWGYLAVVNIALVIFNLVPAFPLDGGRVFRSILWGARGDLRWATKVTSQSGSFFGTFLIIMGILALFQGNIIGGFWWCIIGLFLRSAAGMSYRQLLMKRTLEGEPVSRFMNTEPVTIDAEATVQELVDNFIYHHHHKLYPVTQDGRLIGYVTTRDVKETPREKWSETRISSVVHPRSPENTVSRDTDAMEALTSMNQTRTSRLIVADGDQVAGIISLKDLLQFFALKIDLENLK